MSNRSAPEKREIYQNMFIHERYSQDSDQCTTFLKIIDIEIKSTSWACPRAILK